MDRTINLLLPGFSNLHAEDPDLKVVIACEDSDAGEHAMEVCRAIGQALGGDCRLTLRMWNFDVLGRPSLGADAAREATTADLVMVSSHGCGVLPPSLRSWIERCLVQSSPLALVALFDRTDENDQSVRNFLARAAQRRGIAYFGEPDDWPGQQPKHQCITLVPTFGRSELPIAPRRSRAARH